MLSVASRLGSLPYLANPNSKKQFVLDENCDDDWIQWNLKNWDNIVRNFTFNKESCYNLLHQGLFNPVEVEIADYENGGTPWPITYEFLPDELYRILEENGVQNIELAGPGAYARTIPIDILVKIMKDKNKKQTFWNSAMNTTAILLYWDWGKIIFLLKAI